MKTVKAYKEEKIQLQICRDFNGKLHVSAALVRWEYTATAIKRGTGLNPDPVRTLRKKKENPFPFERIVPQLFGCPAGSTGTVRTTS
jgi:hypothetical protein